MSYQLYVGNKNYSSWSLRPWVLMRALDIPFTEHVLAFGPDNFERFRQFSPSGRVPTLIDGATTVWDTFAIAEYLAEKHPAVWPADRTARAYARSVSAEMHSGFGALRNHCPMNCAVRLRPNPLPAAVASDVARIDELWSEGLRRFGGPFLAGSAFTAADAFYCPVAYRVRSYTLPLSAESAAYVQRLLQLPAMQRWFQDAIAEEWREPQHELETQTAGEIIEDLRGRG